MTEMASIPEFFQVSVWVHCARHLQWAHTNPVVGVSIEGHEKFTVVREDTDCPYYNQYLSCLISSLPVPLLPHVFPPSPSPTSYLPSQFLSCLISSLPVPLLPHVFPPSSSPASCLPSQSLSFLMSSLPVPLLPRVFPPTPSPASCLPSQSLSCFVSSLPVPAPTSCLPSQSLSSLMSSLPVLLLLHIIPPNPSPALYLPSQFFSCLMSSLPVPLLPHVFPPSPSSASYLLSQSFSCLISSLTVLLLPHIFPPSPFLASCLLSQFFSCLVSSLLVYHNEDFVSHRKLLASSSLDVSAVWMEPGHQLVGKWAPLLLCDDFTCKVKGYVRVSVTVTGREGAATLAVREHGEDAEIEGNLLLPRGLALECQRALFVLRVYRAAGVPRVTGLLAPSPRIKKRGLDHLPDLMVIVTFAGFKGWAESPRSGLARGGGPEMGWTLWDSEFNRRRVMALADRWGLGLRSRASGAPGLQALVSPVMRENQSSLCCSGFLPTLGPTFLHLYSPQRAALTQKTPGAEPSYMGRLLVALDTMVIDSTPCDVTSVFTRGVCMRAISPLLEVSEWSHQELVLLGVVFRVTLLDGNLSGQPVRLEFHIGEAGYISNTDTAWSMMPEGGPIFRSSTQPLTAMPIDDRCCYLPIGRDKPCVYVTSTWSDTLHRPYRSNMLEKLANKLKTSLVTVDLDLQWDQGACLKKLSSALLELSGDCCRYQTLCRDDETKRRNNDLDIKRHSLVLRELTSIDREASELFKKLNHVTLNQTFGQARNLLERLQFLIDDPQHCLPDVFVWLVTSASRVAFHRIPARRVLYSPTREQCGSMCATVHAVQLKLPEEKAGSLPAHADMFLWLGPSTDMQAALDLLPAGCDRPSEPDWFIPLATGGGDITLPTHFTLLESHSFLCRCHVYQARLPACQTKPGVSVKVIAGEQVRNTQIRNEPFNPTWDEMLLFSCVTLHGTALTIKSGPPTVVAELWVHEKFGLSECLGRALIKPWVKLSQEQAGTQPLLTSYPLTRGGHVSGHLLIMVQMVEVRVSLGQRSCLLAVSYHMHMRTHLRRLVLRFDWFSRAEDLRQSGQSRDKSDLSRTARTDKAKNLVIGLELITRPLICSALVFRRTCESIVTGKPKCQGETKDEIVSGPNAKIPEYIKPKIVSYRMEVLFWGVRNMKKVQLRDVSRPNVSVECSGYKVSSPIIEDAARNANFDPPVAFKDLTLPDQQSLYPSMTIKAHDHRFFGQSPRVGAHVVHSIRPFLCSLVTDREFKERQTAIAFPQFPPTDNLEEDMVVKSKDEDESLPLLRDAGAERREPQVLLSRLQSILGRKKGTQEISKKQSKEKVNKKHREEEDGDDGTDNGNADDTDEVDGTVQAKTKWGLLKVKRWGEGESFDEDEENLDWWSKYFRTLEAMEVTAEREKPEDKPKDEKINLLGKKSRDLKQKFVRRTKHKIMIKIYPNDLEAQPEFNGFSDRLTTFNLYRGKKVEDQISKGNIAGKFKGTIKIYRWPPPENKNLVTDCGLNAERGLFQNYPGNKPLTVKVRVYVIRASGLPVMDLTGRSDPYLVVGTSSNNTIKDRDSYVARSLDPTFGKTQTRTGGAWTLGSNARGLSPPPSENPDSDRWGMDPHPLFENPDLDKWGVDSQLDVRGLPSPPTFSKLFELKATFPLDYQLTVTVMDYDKYSSDDLIGETKIDLENRWYSKHRAVCGISDKYEK
uniref:C2 domain-containing protein n=1 Tax=Timema bartmani TaxID=61472 RepID=A0A7R9ETD6_9NEOP|nr:unnamed protein product [Timema bartmani]